MLFSKKRRRRHYSRPAKGSGALKWAVILFLGLALIGGMHHKGVSGAGVSQSLQSAAQNLNPEKLLPLDSYKNVIFRADGEALHMKDVMPGYGTPAVCGQQVNITYDTYIGDKETPVETAQTTSFRIGEGKTMPALELGVVGMKKGGKRSLVSPPGMAFGLPEFARPDIPATSTVRFEVELLDTTPTMPDADSTPYRIANVAPGSGEPISCGKPANVQLTIWGLDGKKLYSNKDDAKPLSFTPGKSDVFMGLEQGVIGMQRDSMRTLVVPPQFQTTMSGAAPVSDFPFPKNETVLVDVTALPPMAASQADNQTKDPNKEITNDQSR